MADPQSTEFLKKLVSDRLKRIDGLLKSHKVDEAAEEIQAIRNLDPANPYARAYEERIAELKGKPEGSSAPKPRPSPPPPPISRPAPPSSPPPSPDTPPTVDDTPALSPQPAKADEASSPDIPIMRRATSKGLLLIIDDNRELLEQCVELLEEHEYIVVPFTTADDALKFLQGNQPDLIICDVHLETSSFGGFTFYEKIRDLDHLREVPFLFLSGLKDSRLIIAGKELGADDYLTKPIEPEELLAIVRGKLKRYRQIKKK
jgi:CheY-like chemotaxis protein